MADLPGQTLLAFLTHHRIEKVAIYGEDDTYLHAARLRPDGKWTSKLGPYEDIDHNTLGGLLNGEYGSVVKILRRAIGPHPPP
jgi:hypothetical protein